jgi:cell division septation protein DedD
VFDAPKDLPTPALGTVTLPELTRYAAETEIAAGTGATRTGGKWKLVAGSFDDQPAALALYDRLRAAGYAATIRPGAAGGSGAYRVRIGGLPSRGEALALGERLRADFGLAAPEVAR